MPEGLPSAAVLIEQKAVTFFSIDTDVIQSHGFKFSEGALHALRLQRPQWLQIQLTEVVEREVMAHRMDPVSKAVQELQTAITSVQRLSGQDMSVVKESFEKFDSEPVVRERFSNEMRTFLEQLNGGVLRLEGSTLAHDMFARYFLQHPPFEQKKKSEFPDAASLLLLEEFAVKNNTQGILISKDGGWSKFAKQSERLYCVNSLEEFAGLFESKSEKADRVKAKVKHALLDPTSHLSLQLDSALDNHVSGAFWNADEIYSGYALRVEAEVNQASYQDSDWHLDGLALWLIEHDPSVCTVEISVSVTVDLEVGVDFYQYDTIDHEEICMGSDEITRQVTLNVEVFLLCHGDLFVESVDEWEVDIEITGGEYLVEIGEVNPDYDDHEE